MEEQPFGSSAPEEVPTEFPVVSCSGNEGDGVSGHPLVYLHVSPQGYKECPYCSRRFVLVEQP